MPTVKRVFAGQKNSQPVTTDIGWDSLNLDERFRLSLYGRPATGKTTFSSTFPGPILWLVCSGGNKPGELRSIDTPEMRKKIVPKLIRHSSDVLAASDYARSSGKFETVVMDHASGLANLVITELKQLKEAPFAFAQSNVQAAKGMTLVTEQEWGFIGAECIKILRTILDLDCHSVIISQQKETIPRKKDNEPDFSGEDIMLPFIGSGITPMTVGWLNPATDFILGTFIRPKVEVKVQPSKTKGAAPIITRRRIPGKYEYCLRTGEHDLFTIKLRVPREYRDRVPEVVVDPTYDKLVSVTKGEYQL